MNLYVKKFALSLPVVAILSLQACSSSSNNETSVVPSTNDSGTEQPSVEQPSVEQPSVEQPSVEQPSVEQPSVEQPSVEQPSVEQPSVEQPVDNGIVEQEGTSEPDQPTQGASVALDKDGNQLVLSLAGYVVEDQSEEVLLLADSIVAGAGRGTEQAPGSFSVQVYGELQAADTVRISYGCPLGGTLTQELGEFALYDISYSSTADHVQYDFEQCRIQTDSEQVLSGSVRMMKNSISASRGSLDLEEVQWSHFDWQQGDSAKLKGTALIKLSNSNSDSYYGNRTVVIDHYEHTRQGAVVLNMSNASMKLANATESGVLQSISLDVNGTVVNTSGVPVNVSTVKTIAGELTIPTLPDLGVALSGELRFDADDGGTMTLTMQPIKFKGSLIADIHYVTGSGEDQGVVEQVFTLPTIYAPL